MARTGTLTAERILEATEEVLRRHGTAKATMVDVARALDWTSASLSGTVSGIEAPEAKL
jgi:AcrR family transcriptional regulator